MAVTHAIKKTSTIKKAVKWLDKNRDPMFSLLFQFTCRTGFRITDATEIEWSDFDFDEDTLTIEENKGTRGNKARARLKVLQEWHKRLFFLEKGNEEFKEKLFLTKPKDLLDVLPDKYLNLVNPEIDAAISKAKVKCRTVDIPKELMIKFKQRKHKYSKIDDGFVFSKRTLKSNRARGWHCEDESVKPVVTRQSCLAAFKKMQDALDVLGEKVRSCCHGARKIFARRLFETNGKDLNIVMQTMGWSDVSMVMRYLGFDDENRKTSSANANANWF
jgi:integrase